MKSRRLLAIFLSLLAAPGLRAQTDSLLQEGDRLHRQYRFEQALARYAEAAASTNDPDTLSLLRSRSGRSQNALNLSDFCADPVVVARERFSRADFFLFYPLKNQAWRQGPNVLDPSGNAFPAYVPKGTQTIIYSAPDATGARNLYIVRDQDTLWSAPALLGERLLSPRNEVFPMLSADGKTLTFSSDGFYGMGGYDLYTSTWNEETRTWGEPVNMGIPYSSPADDFLLVDSADGRYTLFASNRSCSPDSVYIYVLEKQAEPLRVPVHDPDLLARMASLVPASDPSRLNLGAAVPGGAPANDDTRLYRQRVGEALSLRDSISSYERTLDTLRLRLSADNGDGRTALTAAVLEKEEALGPLRRRLEEINKAVRRIEQSFLRSGVVPGSDRTAREVVGARSGYTFLKNAYGAKLRLKTATPRTGTSSSYRVAPVGRFAQDTSLPEGVVYQVLLFTSARHATLDEIKGLNPVYERITSSLRYTYSVGLFRTFDEALSHLNPIRHLGFPDAEIVAYLNGKQVPVSAARLSE